MDRTCYLFSTRRRHWCCVVESGEGWLRVDVEEHGVHVIHPSQLDP